MLREAMNGRNGGRKIGRTGPRIGLPLDPDQSSLGGRGSLRPEIGPADRIGYRPEESLWRRPPGVHQAQQQAHQQEHQQGRQQRGHPSGTLPPPPLPNAGSDRISIANLFQHLEPQPQHYRSDAYEDAPAIHHRAPPPTRRGQQALSFGAMGAMIGGAVISLLLVFFAGFLAAVLIFGEPNDGGELAIKTAPQVSSAPDSGISERSESIVTSAEAGRDVLPAPSPEITSAETARDRALIPSGGTVPQTNTAAAGGVQTQVLPAPPSVAAAPAPADTATSIIQPPPVDSNGRIFPPAKPTPPAPSGETAITTTATTAAPATSAPATSAPATSAPAPSALALAPPGGNYSLQFGAFRDRANAQALVRELAASANARVEAETGASGAMLYYVRAGAFQTRADALRAVRQLRQSTGIVTFVHSNRTTG